MENNKLSFLNGVQEPEDYVTKYRRENGLLGNQQAEESPSFLESAWQGAKAQGAGVLGGQADALNVFTGIGKDVADYMQQVQQDNARKKEYSWSEMIPFASDYWTNPQGASFDIGGGLGSSATLMGETLAAGALGSAAGLGSVGASLAGAIGSRAAAAGLPWVGNLMKTPAGKALIANIMSTPFEAVSEGGNKAREIKEAGGDEEAQKSGALKSTALNTALLTFTNTLESTGLGSLISKAGGKNKFMQVMKGVVGDLAQNAYEEGAQTTIGEYVDNPNKGALSIVNPLAWSEEAKNAAAVGGVTGAVMGGGAVVGGKAMNKAFGKSNDEAGQADERERFINAIAGQESGGNYDAVNARTGASGKYQIMPENWPQWAEEAGLGADAEMTPENQETVARYKLGEYYDKYGARGAAMAWYGGEGALDYDDDALNRKQGNGDEPSINEYADSVMQRMGDNSVADSEAEQADEPADEDYNKADEEFDAQDGEKPFADVDLGKNNKEQDVKEEPAEVDYEESADYLDVNPRASYGVNDEGQSNYANTQRLGNKRIQNSPVAFGKYNDKKKFLQLIDKVRNNRAAQKQKALDYAWYMKEHERSQGTGKPVSDDVVQRALNDSKVNLLTERAVGGNPAAQRAFEKMSPTVRQALLNRKADRLAMENEREAVKQYADVAKEPFMPQQYLNDRELFMNAYNRQQQRKDIGAAREPFMPNAAYTRMNNPQAQSYYNGQSARALAAQNAVQGEQLPSVAPTANNAASFLHGKDAQTFREQTLPQIRQQYQEAQKQGRLGRRAQLLSPNSSVQKQASPRVRSWAKEHMGTKTVNQWAKDIKAEILSQHPKRTIQACQEALRDAKNDYKSLLEPIVSKMENGMGNGVSVLWVDENGNPTTEEYAQRGIRASNNMPWYSKYYKENKAKPSKEKLYDIARDIYLGKNEYGVEGESWYDGSPEAVAELADRREQVKYFDTLIAAYEKVLAELKGEKQDGKNNNQAAQERAEGKHNDENAVSGRSTQKQADNVREDQNGKAKEVENKKAPALAEEALPKSKEGYYIAENADDVKQVLKPFAGKPIVNKDSEITATYGTKGIDKMTSGVAVKKSVENGFSPKEHMTAAANVIKLFENGKLVDEHKDNKVAEGEHTNVKSIKVINSPFKVNGKEYNAKITVKESIQAGNKIYSVELLEIEKSGGYLNRPLTKQQSSSAPDFDKSIIPQNEAESKVQEPVASNEKTQDISGDTPKVEFTLRDELHGLEVKFSEKPSADILQRLKDAGYRWSNKKKMWYAYQTQKAMALAEALGYKGKTASNAASEENAKTVAKEQEQAAAEQQKDTQKSEPVKFKTESAKQMSKYFNGWDRDFDSMIEAIDNWEIELEKTIKAKDKAAAEEDARLIGEAVDYLGDVYERSRSFVSDARQNEMVRSYLRDVKNDAIKRAQAIESGNEQVDAYTFKNISDIVLNKQAFNNLPWQQRQNIINEINKRGKEGLAEDAAQTIKGDPRKLDGLSEETRKVLAEGIDILELLEIEEVEDSATDEEIAKDADAGRKLLEKAVCSDFAVAGQLGDNFNARINMLSKARLLFRENNRALKKYANLLIKTLAKANEMFAKSDNKKNSDKSIEKAEPKVDAYIFKNNPEALLNQQALDNLTPSQMDMINDMFERGEKTASRTEAATPAAKPQRFDGKRARSSLDALIGRKKKNEPQQNDVIPKLVNVFNEDELDAEIAKAKAEMNKLSANPMFNPVLMKSLFKIGGIYLQKGVNKFAAWAQNMVDIMGESVRPFLPAVWSSLKKYPQGQKFNDDVMSAVMEYVGDGVDQGKSLSAIKREFADDYGEDYLGYVDAAYEGVKEYPTEIADNVVKSNTEETAKEAKEDGEILRREAARADSDVAGTRPDTGRSGLGGSVSAPQTQGDAGAGTAERGVPAQVTEKKLAPAQKKTAKAKEVPGHNFTITEEENIGKGGPKAKYRDNVEAIKLLKQLEAESRLATPEEQKVLARYVGWGGLSPVFNTYGRGAEQWKNEQQELQGLLTSEEYNAARASTNNAHYTSPEVIKGVWDIVGRLGFKGGRVLEPSMGIGNFYGMMPEAMRSKSALNGVELDSITGRIARQLYQKANVEISGFEQTKYPDNFFDLVVSNVPFGDYKLNDPKYNKYKFNIHNYFFAKSVDQVRPGGLVCFITSTGTMQSGADSLRLRQLLQNKVDFIGALRLPNTAFKENAGTDVTTDLIILQKREAGAEAGKNNQQWLNTVDSGVRSKYGDKALGINEYYDQHPEMMLGKLVEDKLYGGRLALDGTGVDIAAEMAKRVSSFPANIYKPLTGKRNLDSVESAKAAFLAPAKMRYNAYAEQGGKVYQNIDGKMVELPQAAQKKALDYVALRDVTKEILAAQIDPATKDDSLKSLREKLNKVYDAFVAKHGYINDSKNVKALASDPEYGVIAAIEDYKYDKKTKVAKVKKRDIFIKRTVNAIVQVNKADNPADALALSLSNTGAVNVDYMAQLLGKKPQEVVKSLEGLIYENPATRAYETADEYLSGNVREKLEYAREAAKQDKAFEKNVKELEKVQPKDIAPEEISVSLGTPWIPAADVEAFAAKLLDMYNPPFSIKFVPQLGSWEVDWNKGWWIKQAKESTNNTTTWGTQRRDFKDILDAALNQRSLVVHDTDFQGNKTVNQKETTLAQQKIREVQNEFKKWIWSDKERTERLAAYYNRNYNNWRLREYNGSHLTMPGYSAVEAQLYPHQKDAIWRMMQRENTLLAHCVGAGKTWTMQAGAMEMKRLGIIKKPMFVIPNHMLQQFENEFRRIYPNAKLLTISSETLPDITIPNAKKLSKAELARRRAAKNAMRQSTLGRIATEDWDGIIISHNMFKRIPMSDEAYADFYRDQINEMREAIIALNSENDRSSNRLVKDLEKAAKSLEEKLKKDVNEESKDIVIPFEQLGVDQLFVDEADMFKNLGFVTKMTRIAGLSNSSSQRSTDMFLKTQYLTKVNGGRGVVFATGTPISNTMAEMFTMLRYLDMQGLKEKNMAFFDNWAANFANRETTIERSPDGQGYRQAEKFTSFTNMPELIKMFRKVADVKTQEDLHLDIPKLKNGKPTIVEIEPNDALTNYIKNVIADRAKAIHDRRIDPSQDNMLKLTGDLRKASLDMRLVDPTVPAQVAEGKLKAVADKTYDKYVETTDVQGAQLIFCDLSTPKGASDKVSESDTDTEEAAEEGENVTAYEEIKKMLLKKGIPSKEIAFIHDAKTKVQKEELFAKVRAGDVRVLIGSTEKMGAGTNIQDKLVALHHVDAPWRPRDIEQREGRILRKGNQNEEVEIFNYVTKDSFDANMWEKLKNKAAMINQAMSNNLSGRTIEDADANVLTFAEVEALASGNPLMAERTMVSAELNKYETLHAAYTRAQAQAARKAEALPIQIKQAELAIKQGKADIKKRTDITKDNFSITLGKKTYTNRADAKEALEKLVGNYKNELGGVVGKVGGFDLRLRLVKKGQEFSVNGLKQHAQTDGVRAELIGNNIYDSEPSLQSIEYNVMHTPEKMVDAAEHNKAGLEKELSTVQKELNKPFEYESKYNELKKRSAEIDKELGIGEDNAPKFSASDEAAATGGDENITRYSAAATGIPSTQLSRTLYQAAYHGSPYIFDEFSLTAIGTGQHAQSHGWGLYFAKEEATAQGYRRSLTKPSGEVSFVDPDTGKTIKYDIKDRSYQGYGIETTAWNIMRLLHSNKGDVSSAISACQKTIKRTNDKIAELNSRELASDEEVKAYRDKWDKWMQGDITFDELGKEPLTAQKREQEIRNYKSFIEKYQEAITALQNTDTSKLIIPKGASYEADIPESDVLLDEQKSYNEQPSKVKAALLKIIKEGKEFEGLEESIQDNADGRELYGAIMEDIAYAPYDYESGGSDTAMAASKVLNKYGIKGITYNGRKDGRCFVIFDDAAIEIKRRYDEAIANNQSEMQRSYDEVLADAKAAFPKGKFELQDSGDYLVTMPNGAKIRLGIKDRIIVNAKEEASARASHGLNKDSDIVIQGSWTKLHSSMLDGILRVSQESKDTTAFHEAFHAVWDLALTKREQDALLKYYTSRAEEQGRDVYEVMADAYADWTVARREKRSSMFGKLWQKIQDFARRLQKMFTSMENVHDIMRRIETNEVWERDSVNSQPIYSKQEAPKFMVSRDKISDFINTVFNHPNQKLRLVLGNVSAAEAEAIKAATGYDVAGYKHVWRSNDVKHVNNRHGVGAEVNENQQGLTKDDLITAFDVIKAPNKIEKGSPSHGKPSIRFIRRTSDSNMIVVEVVRETDKTLQIKTMWKKIVGKHHGDNALLDTSETAPNSSSSTVSDTISPESGEVKYSARAAAKPLTASEKVAKAFTNTERKGTVQSIKDWIKTKRKNLYSDWIDKNDSLHGFDEAMQMGLNRKLTEDELLYNKAQTMAANSAGMANALIEGGRNNIAAINKRLKNKKLKCQVTLSMVLNQINRTKMNQAHPGWLEKHSEFANWVDAFGAYLGCNRLLEMSRLAKQAGEVYKLPDGMTEADLQAFINTAPKEFKKAAEMYYMFNDNVLTIMEDAGLISDKVHEELSTKYKHYCPLMRDFSDTAAADAFIGGLGKGGNGIGNVSTPLKRISIKGSERNVLNPLESTIKAVSVVCNRAERNKVGQMAVDMATEAGLENLVVEVPGTTADAKNCIFTVMKNGKKVAYKTTQDLYGPIAGYNEAAAGLMFGVARNAARLLRAGATMSPSFIVRNLIRDTIFAGISSQNGFVPVVDTIRGAYALLKNKEMRAEFETAGVTQFNFYGSSEAIAKSLDEMAGGKDWREYGPADIWRAIMKYPAMGSEFVESATRMGEFLKARQNGKSIDAAARAARELTLDFSRSGVSGEKVNQVVPFFNACLQGGDKLYRLLRDNPVQTSMKLAQYIVLPSLILWCMNHDEDWYKELDPGIKNSNWCLPGGLRIPKPQEAGVLFGSGIEAMLDAASGQDKKALANWADTFIDNMKPGVIPTVFLPILEWQANYSYFRNQQLVSKRLQRLPDEQQYTNSTSEASKAIGRVTGLSPVKIDNTIRGYTGTMGMFLWGLPDGFAAEKQNLPEKKLSEMQFFRDFNVTDMIQNRRVNEFYYLLDAANKQHAGYGVKGRPTKAVQSVRTAGKMINDLNKDIQSITNSRLSSAEKRKRIDKKRTQIKRIAQLALSRYGKYFED